MENKLPVPYFFQKEAVDKCIEYINGPSQKPVVVVGPTASGKSLMLAFLASWLGKPILNIVPSKELLEQNFSKLTLMGGTATIYSASMGEKIASELTFATMGSIVSEAKKFKDLGIEIVTVDECHFKVPPDPESMFMKFIRELAPKKVIGFTATPFFLKNSMMGAELKFLTRMRPSYFKEVLHVIPISLMVEGGFWSKLYYEEHHFDESGLKLNSSGSDFTLESVRESVKVQGINNNIYVRVKELVKEGRRILIFMDTVENAIKMSQVLTEKGIAVAANVHAKTPKNLRDQIVSKFRKGEVQVVSNVGILTTGFDYPELDCVILGTASNSLAWYYQVVGRGTRKHANKDHCLIIDFAGNVKRFGRIETLEIIDHPGFGWGVFNNDILLTNTPMAGLKRTKADLNKSGGNSDTIWFGKFKGEKLENLPVWYIDYLLKPDSFQNPSNSIKKLQQQLRVLVAKNNTILQAPQ